MSAADCRGSLGAEPLPQLSADVLKVNGTELDAPTAGDDQKFLRYDVGTNSMIWVTNTPGEGVDSVAAGTNLNNSGNSDDVVLNLDSDLVVDSVIAGSFEVTGEYTLPLADGTVGQAIVTDGSGTCTYQDVIESIVSADTNIDVSGAPEVTITLNETPTLSNTIYSVRARSGNVQTLAANTSYTNTAFGFSALENDVDGQTRSTAVGYQALQSNAYAVPAICANTAVGYQAGSGFTASHDIIAVGSNCLQPGGAGHEIIAIGNNSANLVNGSGNVFIGSKLPAAADINTDSTFIVGVTDLTEPSVSIEVFRSTATATTIPGKIIIGNGTPSTNYELPTARGTNNQILKSDGSGVVTWSADNDAITSITSTGSTIVVTGTETINLEVGATQSLTGLTVTDSITFGSGATNYTFPTTRGTNAQLLKINGSGNLTFEDDQAGGQVNSIGSSANINVDDTDPTAPVVELTDDITLNNVNAIVGFTLGTGATNITFPVARGTENQILKIDGSGVLGFSTDSGGAVDSITAGTNIAVTGTSAIPIVGTVATPTFTGLVIGTMTYPTSDGTVGQCLRTDGAGLLSWETSVNTVESASANIVKTGTAMNPIFDLAASPTVTNLIASGYVTTGSNSVIIGDSDTGSVINKANGNVLLGNESGKLAATTSGGVICVGQTSAIASTLINDNILIGNNVMKVNTNTLTDNVIIGQSSNNATTDSACNDNVLIGNYINDDETGGLSGCTVIGNYSNIPASTTDTLYIGVGGKSGVSSTNILIATASTATFGASLGIGDAVYILPGSAGTSGQLLKFPSSGTTLEWADDETGGQVNSITSPNSNIVVNLADPVIPTITFSDTPSTSTVTGTTSMTTPLMAVTGTITFPSELVKIGTGISASIATGNSVIIIGDGSGAASDNTTSGCIIIGATSHPSSAQMINSISIGDSIQHDTAAQSGYNLFLGNSILYESTAQSNNNVVIGHNTATTGTGNTLSGCTIIGNNPPVTTLTDTFSASVGGIFATPGTEVINATTTLMSAPQGIKAGKYYSSNLAEVLKMGNSTTGTNAIANDEMVAIGDYAAAGFNSVSSSANVTALGHNTLRYPTTVNNVVALGNNVASGDGESNHTNCVYVGNSVLSANTVQVANNIMIGNNILSSATNTVQNSIVIGNYPSATRIDVGSSNKIFLVSLGGVSGTPGTDVLYADLTSVYCPLALTVNSSDGSNYYVLPSAKGSVGDLMVQSGTNTVGFQQYSQKQGPYSSGTTLYNLVFTSTTATLTLAGFIYSVGLTKTLSVMNDTVPTFDGDGGDTYTYDVPEAYQSAYDDTVSDAAALELYSGTTGGFAAVNYSINYESDRSSGTYPGGRLIFNFASNLTNGESYTLMEATKQYMFNWV